MLDLLTLTSMLRCAPANTPIVHNHHLAIYPNQVPTNQESYHRLVGKLIYLSHTRPCLACAISIVSQFMHSPNEEHQAMMMRYLKGAPGKG